MAIQMIGIDHSVAAIDIRTIFSFTQKKIVEALEIIKQEKGICGCVLLSTCNRMELWVSTEEGCVIALYELLCKIRAKKKMPCSICSVLPADWNLES